MKDFTESALLVLFVLDRANMPMSEDQLDQTISAASDYTYLENALSLNSLEEKGYVAKSQLPAGTFYTITINGRITLSHLTSEIRGSIRRAIEAYCRDNLTRLKTEASFDCTISVKGNGCYVLILRAFDSPVSELCLTTMDEQEARTIARNWKKHGDRAIAALLGDLSVDEDEPS